MVDIVDIYTQTQQEIDYKIAVLRSKRVNTRLPHIGICYNCEEAVLKPKLFCNGECATDYDKYIKQQKINTLVS